MKNKRCVAYILCLVLCLCCKGLAGNGNIGNSARSMSLAYTMVSVADDPTAIYWNPAGISQAKGLYTTFANPYGLDGSQIISVGGIRSVTSGINVGILYNNESNKLISFDRITNYSFSYLGVGIGFDLGLLAKENGVRSSLPGNISIGTTISSTKEAVGTDKFSAINLTVGTLWQHKFISLGAVARDLFTVDPKFSFGASLRINNLGFIKEMKFLGDLIIEEIDDQYAYSYTTGVEASLGFGITARIGMTPTNLLRTFGLGFSKNPIVVDYAMDLYGDERANYLSFGLRF